MNELSLEELKKINRAKLFEMERERLMMNIEHTGKNLLWYFSGVLSALIAVYAISMSM